MVALGLLIAVVAVTTALSGAEMQYREESVLDPLTGLLNRSGLESRFDEVREQARLLDKPVCLLTCDLDEFKRDQRHLRTRPRRPGAPRRHV